MIRTQNTRRAGFTLVELLVSISIFIGLAGLVLLLYPNARDQDRVRYAVSDISAHLRMAQSMAARDKAPRGVRFLVSLNTQENPDKTDSRWATELQFIEQPPPLIPNRTPLSSGNPDAEPRVRFQYEVSDGTNPDRFGRPAQPAGTIVYRQCVIENLTGDQVTQIKTSQAQGKCTLVMPVYGFWSKIASIPATQSMPYPPGPLGPRPNENAVSRGSPTVNAFDLEVTLEVYPDAIMGGSTHNLTHQFAVYLTATALVGEPTILLPKNICVDLNTPDYTDSSPTNWRKVGSIGPPLNTTQDFDVLFGPDGKLVNSAGGQVILHVRNYTKVPTMQLPDGAALLNAFQKGGEQHFIMIRSSGALGHNEVAWPNSTGAYTNLTDPFRLVRDENR